MPIQKEIWLDHFVQDLFPDNSFLSKSFNADEFVRAGLTAAASRLGYAGPVRSLRTTGRVYGGLLAHSFRRAQACFDAMESRCYDGGIRFLTREKPVRAPHALVCGALTAGMVLALVCGA